MHRAIKKKIAILTGYLAAVCASLLIWEAASLIDNQKIFTQLNRAAKIRTALLQDNINFNTTLLKSVERFFASSEFISENEFLTFNQDFHNNKSIFSSISWVTRLTADKFGLPDSFTILYKSPVSADEKISNELEFYISFINKNPKLLSTLRGEKITEPMTILNVSTNGNGFAMLLPVFSDLDKKSLEGFILGTVRFKDLFSYVFKDFPVTGNPHMEIFSNNTVTDSAALHSYFDEKLPGSDEKIHTQLIIAGEEFDIVSSYNENFINYFSSNIPLILLLSSILLSTLTAIYLLINQKKKDLIRESEDRFISAFNFAAHGMAIVSIEGRWLKVNSSVCKITGYPESELLPLKFQDITHPEDLEKDMQYVREMLEYKRDSYNMEKRYIRKDGEIVWVLLSVSLVSTDDKKPLYFVSQIQDITDRKYTEKELADKNASLELAKAKAEIAVEAKSRFLANMSHEIRTPLTAIYGFSEQLSDPEASPVEKHEFTQIVIKNTEYLLALVNDILDFSKIEAGKLSIQSEKCDLFSNLSFIESALSPRMKEKNLEFAINFNFPLPRTIHCDPLRLNQILFNLIGNAIKFTNQGSIKLDVSFNAVSGNLVFQITDTGIGLSEEQLPLLFQAFSQADGSTTKKFGGTGLGLAISRNLAKIMGGDIEVSSTIGKGSIFKVTIFPGECGELVSSKPESSSGEFILKNSAPLSGKVLLAEDCTANQKLIRRLLEKRGLNVQIVTNGKEAVTAALKENFDIILMDMQMPVLDGYSATQQLINAGCKIPIVACTADASNENEQKLLNLGCSDVLFKPFSASAMQELLSRYF